MAAYAYVPVFSDATVVAVVDTVAQSVVDTIAGGVGPISAATSPDGTLVYVANEADNSVSVIEVASNTVVQTITGVDAGPESIVVHPNGLVAYVTCPSGGVIDQLDLVGFVVSGSLAVGVEPWALALTPDGATLYAADQHDFFSDDPTHAGRVYAIDTGSLSLAATIILPTPFGWSVPYGIGVTPDGQYLYVPNAANLQVQVVEVATNTIFTSINLFGVRYFVFSVVFSPDGATAYCPGYDGSFAGTIATFDVASSTLSGTVGAPGAWAFGFEFLVPAISADGSTLYVTDGTSALVTIDIGGGTLVGTVDVGVFPASVALAGMVGPPPAVQGYASAGVLSSAADLLVLASNASIDNT